VRADAPIRGHGQPFIVLEVIAVPLEMCPTNGFKLDIRLATLNDQDNETIAPLWMESWWLEPWSVQMGQLAAATPEGSS
jgi:hypothetical protein